MLEIFRTFQKQISIPVLVRILLLTATTILAILSLILPIAIRPSSFPLSIGEVATQDIQAPRSLTYQSEVLTEQSRKNAEISVSPIFSPSDPGITRTQIEHLREALAFIDSIRMDSYSTQVQKQNDLKMMNQITISTQDAARILALSDPRWQGIKNESLAVLEEVMRKTIRSDQLADAQRSVPTMISFSLSQDQANLVTLIVTPFVIPNSVYSEDLTQQARLQARSAAQTVSRSFTVGETIVSRGQVILPETLEALKIFGLIQSPQNENTYLSAVFMVCLNSLFVVLYFIRRKNPLTKDFRSLALISFTFLVFLFGARFVIPNRTIIPYLFPLAAFGLSISSLYSTEIGLTFTLPLSILAAYGMPNSLELTLYYLLSSMCGILVLGKGMRIANFFKAGIFIGLTGSVVILSYRLSDTITDWIGITTLIGISFLNGIASASLTLILQFLFSQLIGLTTALQLMDLSRPDHPLLQFLLRNAPGTYQHSLQVANLAEQAADSIGADSLLTRVGALYHDAGKATNPSFFVENQIPGKINPHDDLDPVTSAKTILQHVYDGLSLGKKYHLPPRILDFIAEHHGDLLTRYQYTRALQASGDETTKVDKTQFQYPGPKPHSRETAVLMLADGCEARARAELPKDEAEIKAMVRKVVDYVQKEGQLDNTSLTFHDLSLISSSFVSTLRNLYHPRLQYPEYKPTSSGNLPSVKYSEEDNFLKPAPYSDQSKTE